MKNITIKLFNIIFFISLIIVDLIEYKDGDNAIKLLSQIVLIFAAITHKIQERLNHYNSVN